MDAALDRWLTTEPDFGGELMKSVGDQVRFRDSNGIERTGTVQRVFGDVGAYQIALCEDVSCFVRAELIEP